ncbi:helix-turn-helix domain-containing protein [Streptomyces sp. NBC_00723]|uniref:helix-turn-helix domain-containing protein n=1 Tax=Streptomyces sp. NBC_00723 TaxID=2903673 RepID=UPI00386A9289
MERDWARLARAIKRARDAAGMTQRDLAAAAAIAEGSVQNLESGASRTRVPPSLAKVERALGWVPGSGVDILDGASGPVLLREGGGGFQVTEIPEGELEEAVTMSVIAATDDLTAREIRDLARRITEELKKRRAL